jgi:rRNA maturation endonuclease Nob1
VETSSLIKHSLKEREMNKYPLVDTQDYLLRDILEVLERIENKMDKPKAVAVKKAVKKVIAPTVRERDPIKVQPKIQNKICKSCGEPHENNWDYGICARKKKKEGA